MSKPKVITDTSGVYRLEWTVGAKDSRHGMQMYNVDVFRGDVLLIQWAYPRVKGCGGLLGHAVFWRDQAVMQAQAEEKSHGL